MLSHMDTIHKAEQMTTIFNCTYTVNTVHITILYVPLFRLHILYHHGNQNKKNNVLSHGRTATFPYVGNVEKKTPWVDKQAEPTLYLQK
jgi:hypothetical protein